MTGDAHDIARMLSARAADLARALLPRGHRRGAEWIEARQDQGGFGDSLSVCTSGPKAGLWAHRAKGEGGDALDLVCKVLFPGDKRAALAWSRRWLGLGEGPVPPARREVPQGPSAEQLAEAAAEEAAKHGEALAIYLAAAPITSGSPAWHWFTGRRIALAELGRLPRALRCHAGLWNAEARRSFPAVVAAILNAEGEHIGTHCTWLAPQPGGGWGKAPVETPRKVKGKLGGGHIPIWRGATGRPLKRALPGEAVVLCEGIETALSVALACPELRVLSALNVYNLGKLTLPPAITRIIIAAENDTNPAPRAALELAIKRYAEEGRDVRIARSPIGNDFNDCLKAE